MRSSSFAALGTTVALVVTDDAALPRARAMLHREIDPIDAACSRFRDDSELSMVNCTRAGRRRVSDLFMQALDAALRALVTGGAVDPTVGTSMRVLGYDRSFDDIDRNGPALEVTVPACAGLADH